MTILPTKKNHHFVPKFILNNFVAENGRTWFLRKSMHSGPQLKLPVDVLFEFHANTFVDINGQKNSDVEDELGKIESSAAPILRKVIESALKQSVLNLTLSEKMAIQMFILVMFKRSPYVRNKHATEQFYQDTIQSAIDELLNAGFKLPESLASKIQTEEWKARTLKEASVKATLMHSEEILALLAQRGLAVGVSNKEKKSFVVGDVPFLRYRGVQHDGLKDPTSEFWIPIAPRVVISPFGDDGAMRVFSFSGEIVRQMNIRMWNQSCSAVSTSGDLLSSLSNQR